MEIGYGALLTTSSIYLPRRGLNTLILCERNIRQVRALCILVGGCSEIL